MWKSYGIIYSVVRRCGYSSGRSNRSVEGAQYLRCALHHCEETAEVRVRVKILQISRVCMVNLVFEYLM